MSEEEERKGDSAVKPRNEERYYGVTEWSALAEREEGKKN